MTWHVDQTALTRWVEGNDGSLGGASIEQHLLTCAECRSRVPKPAALDDVWLRVRDELEAPQVSWLERVLVRAGVDTADARVIAVSPAFRASWITGLAVVLVFVVTAAMWADARGEWLFLLVAPLVPAAGVAIGYDPETEPALEQESSTPYCRGRMVLLRSLVLIVSGLPLVVGLSFLLPEGISFLWLLPAATLTVGVLAASTWVPPMQAAGVLGLGWLVVAASIGRERSPEQVLAGGFLVAYIGLAVLAVAVLVVRRSRFGETFGSAS